MREVPRRRKLAVAVGVGVLLSVAVTPLLAGCASQPQPTPSLGPTAFVMDDFESGTLSEWRTAGAGSGGWYIYTDGNKAPDPDQTDPNMPFKVPAPPQGTRAAVTDMRGPGTRILYRDLKLTGRLTLHVTFSTRVPRRSPPRRASPPIPRSRTSSSAST